MVDRAIANYCRADYCRASVYLPLWDVIIKKYESLTGPVSLDVTRRKLVLGAPDSITGWYAKDFSNTSTIEAIIIERASRHTAAVMGTYVRTDALALMCDGVLFGDEIETAHHVFYEVKGIRELYVGDSFSHREVDLTLLPLHGLSYSPTAPTVNDARYNMKDYLETRVDDDNLQGFNWIVCYSDADYPLVRVFDSEGVAIIFTIDSPDSSPLMQGDLTPYGYEEHVPVHIVTLDTEVNHLAEAELRRVTETFPTGSQRGLERRGTTVLNYGSTQVFDTEFLIDYRRGTT